MAEMNRQIKLIAAVNWGQVPFTLSDVKQFEAVAMECSHGNRAPLIAYGIRSPIADPLSDGHAAGVAAGMVTGYRNNPGNAGSYLLPLLFRGRHGEYCKGPHGVSPDRYLEMISEMTGLPELQTLVYICRDDSDELRVLGIFEGGRSV